MSVKSFKFVSPGIFINEIDNSALPAEPTAIGPCIIGRTLRGPGMRPVRVTSFEEFIDVFGPPEAGGNTADAWLNPNKSSAMYAPYAAQAYFANSSPVTVVRLLGEENTNATSDGYAGWVTSKNALGSKTAAGDVAGGSATAGGAYGLFLVASGSSGNHGTGTLAAVWYLNQGAIMLQGSHLGTSPVVTASNMAVLQSNGDYSQFDAVITGTNVLEKIRFNFNVSSPNYIRKVFNTNPALCNSTITTNTKNYWLGETFTRNVIDNTAWLAPAGDAALNPSGVGYAAVGTGGASGATLGFMLGLESDGTSDYQWADQQIEVQEAKTGWVISQDTGPATAFLPTNAQKLFKVVSQKAGEWDQQNIKVSIQDLRAPANSTVDPFTTFTVAVRYMADSDNDQVVYEKFSNCNLNPASPNYVARKIGDKYFTFDTVERRMKEVGQYDLRSRYIRLEMDTDVDSYGVSTEGLIPFGFYAPPVWKGWSITSGTAHPITQWAPNDQPLTGSQSTFADAMGGVRAIYASTNTVDLCFEGTTPFLWTNGEEFSASFDFPRIPVRLSSSDGGVAADSDAFYGFTTGRTPDSTTYDYDTPNLLRGFSDRGFYTETTITPASLNSLATNPFVFTMDDIREGASGGSYYQSGSRTAAASLSAAGYTKSSTAYTGYEATLMYGADKFTMPVFGGRDGFNIKEKDPFRNSQWTAGSSTGQNSYAYNSIKQAIDIIRDADLLEQNLSLVPGIDFKDLTKHLINTSAERADTMAIIDVENDYVSAYENTSNFADRRPDVDAAVQSMKTRNLDSSYGAAYYPWVQIFDNINDQYVWVPPSVIALGTMSYSQAVSEPWFAPAGFNRGGLSNGAAGLPVTGITTKLVSKERDKLYDVNVNPIASFPSEGLVVFGQKTLQAKRSALDRVNVRRLLILLKKEISRFSTTVLFDPNVEVTWARFAGLVEPFLRSVQVRLGLEDYKLVLDKTTTTPELVDRNIMYAKIFLKPAKAIEYIAIDFNITRSGASFDE